MSATRTETDSFGPLEVPADKYWGAQTQRSIMNFPIGWEKQPVAIVRALGVIKQACAMANKASGKLDDRIGDAVIQAASEVVAGKFDDNFPLVVWQTGSGTQSNMNSNEVIANRARRADNCCDGVRPSIAGRVIPRWTCPTRPATRIIMNSSRLLPDIDRNRRRSSNGYFSWQASARTRSLKLSQESSRLK